MKAQTVVSVETRSQETEANEPDREAKKESGRCDNENNGPKRELRRVLKTRTKLVKTMNNVSVVVYERGIGREV